jgi:hypothetical protein
VVQITTAREDQPMASTIKVGDWVERVNAMQKNLAGRGVARLD